MLYFVEVFIFVLLLVVWWRKIDGDKYSKSPPGPFRFPIFGNVPQIIMENSKSPLVAMKNLAEKYGDIMFIKMGAADSVVFSSHDAVRDILIHDHTDGRIQFENIRDRHDSKNLGLIWGYGKPWQTLRRFTMRNLRDFGFGKSSQMDALIIEELEKFMNYIRKTAEAAPNNVLHVEDMFNMTFVNVLWLLVAGKAYNYDDNEMKLVIKLTDDFYRSSNLALDITHVFPILRDWFPNWSGRSIQKRTAMESKRTIKQLLDEERARGTYKTDPQNFLDVFAAKVEQSKDDPNTDFTEEQFILCVLDLHVGGSETSSKTLTFGILYMILNPHVQQKVQEEIDRVIPDDVQIDSTMKSRLPYTYAAVLEVFRHSTVLPFPTAREATEDFMFRGYLIRKGTALMPNIHAVHFNKSLWGDPLNFRPERFLNADGTGIDKSVSDKLSSFGAGRRYCLGESLAEATVFMYFATMLRFFTFSKLPGQNPSSEPILGLTSSPQPFDVKIVYRN